MLKDDTLKKIIFLLLIIIAISCKSQNELNNSSIGLNISEKTDKHVGEKLVFAHVMMTQPTYSKTVEGYVREIADARSMGIDGFVIELFGYETHPASRKSADMVFEAAAISDPTFKVFLMLSVPGNASGNWTASDMVAAVRKYGTKPNYFYIDGRPVVATWRGEQMDPNWWANNVIGPLKATGLTPYFMPYFPNKPIARVIDGFGSMISAYYNFAVGDLDKGIATSREWDKLFATRQIPFIHAFGPTYWQVCSDKPGESRYFEHQAGEGFAKNWAYVLNELKPNLAIYSVWNDFGEDNFMTPADEPPAFFRNTAVPTWTHRGFSELSKYYTQWFKTGAPPTIERDAMFFFYRQHPKDLAPPPGDQCLITNQKIQQFGDVHDDLYITTMLSAPAELRVVTGGHEMRQTMAAGIQHTRVPFALGTPLFELLRNGKVIARKAGTLEITDKPTTRNFHVYGDYAYADKIEPEPIASDVYISDIPWSSELNGAGTPLQRDKNRSGGTIKLNGVSYNKGVGAHAYSKLEINLSGKYSHFKSDIGLDDLRNGSCGSVKFEIDVDGTTVYTSGSFIDTTPTKSIEIAVTGKNLLVLKVLDNGDGLCGDHGNWANARLTP